MRGVSIAIIAAASTVAFAPIASAADMPVKAPVAPAVIPAGWSGFYAGANVGYSWGRSDNDWNYFAAGQGGSPLVFKCPSPQSIGLAFCAAGSDSTNLNGAIGGGQAGYNWQIARYLVGIETDFQFSGQRGNSISNAINATNQTLLGIPVTGTAAAGYTEKLTWFGTLRGRVGFITDRWLVYATGGLAYGRVTIDGTAAALGIAGNPGCTDLPPPSLGATCPLGSFNNGVTKAGWTIGAGVEGMLAGNWSWKVEYLHVDLGTINTVFPTLPGCFGGFLTIGGASSATCNTVTTGSGTVSSRITDEIVRIGVNYRFAAVR